MLPPRQLKKESTGYFQKWGNLLEVNTKRTSSPNREVEKLQKEIVASPKIRLTRKLLEMDIPDDIKAQMN
jgi:hypothetical protein